MKKFLEYFTQYINGNFDALTYIAYITYILHSFQFKCHKLWKKIVDYINSILLYKLF